MAVDDARLAALNSAKLNALVASVAGRPCDEVVQPGLSLTDAALMSLDAMQASISRCMLAAYPPDLLIEIPINTCGAHEFYRASEVIGAGEYWAEQAIERFTNGDDTLGEGPT